MNILIVEDDAAAAQALSLTLEDAHSLVLARSAEEALALLEKRVFAVVLCDLTLPGAGGEALLAHIKATWPGTEVLMVTAARDVEVAVRCMRIGAYDYIAKPWNAEALRAGVARAAEKWRLSQENNLLKQGQPTLRMPSILGGSEAMKAVRELIAKVAAHDSVVLIQGDSGTGKELVARAIHMQSARRRERFVAIACGSIPADLVESELFGHEKGAFSSAYAARIGKFEYAGGGTIFLDDIATLPLPMQAKLLRVLQEREICRLGSNRVIPVDVRVISSSNVDLPKLVRLGKFREDLYWRLSGVPVYVPPLVDREGDSLELFGHFLAEVAARYQRPVPKVSENVLQAIRTHSFPGNVRELQHLAETLFVLGDKEEIGVSALPLQMLLPRVKLDDDNIPMKRAVHEFERQMITQTLRSTRGNQSKAADMLGIHRNTLLMKIAEMEMPTFRLRPRKKRGQPREE